MEIKNCIDQMKNTYDLFLKFIDDIDPVSEIDYMNLVRFIDNNKIHQNKDKFNHFIKILVNVSNDHHRQAGFFDKIERILIKDKDNIKANRSNIEIYQQFESSKRLLYFLIKEKILIIDKTVTQLIESNGVNYSIFFLPEIKKSDSNDEELTYYMKNLEEYEAKRYIGENDSYVCALIRQDSIEEFVTFLNKTNLSPSSHIKASIFETNSFLIDKDPMLIEYAALFGSIQIFQYLYLNQANVDGYLWLYGIHSNNSDLLRNYIESNHIKPNDETYKEILNESIKCHHNEIAKFIQENYLTEKPKKIESIENISEENFFFNVLQYHNYFFLPSDFDQTYAFYHLCECDYLTVVELLIEKYKENLNTSIQKDADDIRSVYHFLSGLNEINENCFAGFRNLSKCAIPLSISSIGKNAFFECQIFDTNNNSLFGHQD